MLGEAAGAPLWAYIGFGVAGALAIVGVFQLGLPCMLLVIASRTLLAPELVVRGDFKPLMVTGIATIRGLRMLRAVASEAQVQRSWPSARDQLLAGLGG